MTNIRVALRVRPLSQRETEGNFPVVVAVENNSAFITDIRVPEKPSADSRQRFRQFDFDHTFWFSNHGLQGAASQLQVYTEIGPHLENAILTGYNACLLAYGQSGTGKTHTMLGSKDSPGIIPRLCHSLWDKLKVKYPPVSGGKPSFSMEVSFLEIYREKVRDLLNPEKSLKLREHPQLGPHVQGLTRLEVTGEISLLDLLWEGERRRASGTTSSNRRSSRSHAIWTLYLTVHNNVSHSNPDDVANNNDTASPSATRRNGKGSSQDNPSRGSPTRIITNQVHLVDLAGSEKADCTTAKSLLAEGADINRSLVALGNVISALAEKAQYIPYRDSALTWLLKDSIGGNASTSIIITASPSSHCHAQTLNSLRFAQRARLVENTPKINLASASPSYYGPYGHLSVMSAMELKKDISRLAKIIKTAQNLASLATEWAFGSPEPRKFRCSNLLHIDEVLVACNGDPLTLDLILNHSKFSSMLLDYPNLERWRINNGGILRGLAPRTGWTRLIHAIEGISEAEREQIKLQRERACSEDTTASSSQAGTSSSSTITAAKSLNDVMVQADMEKRKPPLRRHQSTALPTTCSSPAGSPTKIVGTEVFIPTSNSYKCLTWQQEESHPVPKPNTSSSTSSLSEEPDDGSSTPLQSASSMPHIYHMKYPLKVQYPISHNLEHASRISERIHGSFLDENYQNKTELLPVEVEEKTKSNSPLVQQPIATLVNPIDLPLELIMNEQVKDVPGSRLLNKKTMGSQSALVTNIPKSSQTFMFPMRCRSFASALTTTVISPYESTDENEFYEPEEIDLNSEKKYRAIHTDVSKNLETTLQRESKNCTFEDTCYFTAGESVLSQLPTMLISSSSSYESINLPEKVRPVNLVRDFSHTSDYQEDQTQDFVIDNEVFSGDYEPPIANICMVAAHPMDNAVPIEILVAEPSLNANGFNPINGVSDSKFRNYFAKELHQMERMGKQIKSLLQMTQRYNVVKPYLDEISNLQNSDHSKPDPKLDAHIESCSSWNVDVELAKVHQEIHSLNKVLKTGIGSESSSANMHAPPGKGESRNPFGKYYNAPSVKDSTTSNEGGLTSDSSIDVDFDMCASLPSFAHTRHIPLLSSGKSDTSTTSGFVPHYGLRRNMPTLVTAKGTVSQPILSSSSNNGSVTSGAGCGAAGANYSAGNSRKSSGDSVFTPSFYSTPNRKHWNRDVNDVEEDEPNPSSLPPQFPHHVTFRAHTAAPSVNSTHTFYRNPSMNSMDAGGSGSSTRLQYCPSNSNMSSISINSNISTSVNYDTNSSSYPNSAHMAYPLNISHSEPKKLPSGKTNLTFGNSNGQWRVVESASDPNPYLHFPHHANSFNGNENRSHRRGYESSGSPATRSRLSSTSKVTENWMPNAGGFSGGARTLNNFKKLGVGGGEPAELDGYQYLQQQGKLSGSDSLDLCSCDETGKYGSLPVSLSRLEKSTSRSQISNFGGSTTTETSEYSGRPTTNSYQHQPLHPNPLRVGNNSNYLRSSNNHPLTQIHAQYKLPSRMNRNEKF
ncbi:unnamed protein product [Orchesella dallaii]|uniref:Kinesin motor domain-containing protein n=1 Tax=Orchesella dallaii TaxID=48710 RepID=A0ABP1RBS5_9HEXA